MKKKNLYFILSETLWETIPILDYGVGPREPYRMCEFVLAETRAKAKTMVMKENKFTIYDVRDIPKFFTQTLGKGFMTTSRIVTQEKSFEQFWKEIDFHREEKFCLATLD